MKKDSILLILYIFLLLGIIYYIFFYQPSNSKTISEKDIIEDNKMEENVKQDSLRLNKIDNFPKVDKSVLNRFIIFIVLILMSLIGYYVWKYTKQKVTKQRKREPTPDYTDIHEETPYKNFTQNPFYKSKSLKPYNKTGNNKDLSRGRTRTAKIKNDNYPNANRKRNNKLESPIEINEYIKVDEPEPTRINMWDDINNNNRRGRGRSI